MILRIILTQGDECYRSMDRISLIDPNWPLINFDLLFKKLRPEHL